MIVKIRVPVWNPSLLGQMTELYGAFYIKVFPGFKKRSALAGMAQWIECQAWE